MQVNSDFRQILSRPVDIFSDSFIRSLYEMPWQKRNWFFVNLFKNLELAHKYDTNPCPQIGKSHFQNPKGWVNMDSKPPFVEGWTYNDYVATLPNFNDPFPNNVVEHEGVMVVRDDLIPGNLGSKARYAEALVQNVKEKYITYAMVKSGQAMKVLAHTCKKYDKILIGIAPNRTKPTDAHIEAMEMGAIMLYYQTGGMAGARKRCRALVHDQLLGNGLYIPAGVKHPYITSGFAQSVNKIYNQFKPDVIFCATSTAVMAHGMMLGTPEECEIHAVQVGDNSSLKKWPGRAKVYQHWQSFSEDCKKENMPPFDSISNYDAKVWAYARDYKKDNPDKRVMMWNVAGEVKL